MIEIYKKEDCCGCTACYNICPAKAIDMEVDVEGFKYPVFNKEKCVSCGACERVCPIRVKSKKEEEATDKYAVQNCKEEERYQSTAGGFFSIIADYVIENNGVVYAVGYDNLVVAHKEATSIEQLEEMRGSKYVQSELSNTFTILRENLKKGVLCLFVGTPCQVHGLINYLGKPYQNLIAMDLLCLGVSSPKLYMKWIAYLQKKYRTNVKRVYFRDKSYGYSTANVRVAFEKKKPIEQCYDAKSLMKTFFSGYNMRPSCYRCEFRCVDRVSDFTIGDFHQIGNYCKEMDDDKGTTCLWIHTVKGKEIFNKVKTSIGATILSENISSTLDKVSQKTKVPENRNAFYEDVDTLEYDEFVKKWAPNDFKGQIINIVKPIINKTPLRGFVFRLIKKRKQINFEKRVKEANMKEEK